MIIEINNAILSDVAPWMGTIAVVTNHIVVLLSIAIYMKTKKKNHKPAFVFIGFLAFIDIVIGGAPFVLPPIDPYYWLQKSPDDECRMRGAPSAFIVAFSHHMMLALTMDRYIFIKHPLHYPMIITPTQTWFIVLLAILGAVANSVICALAFQANSDGLCTWLSNAPTWVLVMESLLYVVILGFVIFVYVVMVAKFRQSRKKLEALQKLGQEDLNEMQKPKFQRTFLTISKTVQAQTIPDIKNKDVFLVRYKNSVGECKEEKMNKPIKRRSSSVVKRFSTLVSHARAAKYVLVIVSAYLATWTPFFGYCLYKSLTRVYLDKSVDVELCLNITVLRSCISDALQNQSCIIQSNI